MPTSPISLYIELEPDSTAELENVARASLAFAAGIREAAYLFDPSFQFRIELVRGDESSLWLKARLRWLRGIGNAHPQMYAMTLFAAGWFGGQTAGYAYEALLDHLFKSSDPEIVRLDPAQIDDITRRLAILSEAKTPGEHFRQVYRELLPDPAVRGVGASPSHTAKPPYIVPKADFATRMEGPAIDYQPGELRTRPENGDYVIIRPVLKEGGGMWRLRGSKGEFSATIADDQFYNEILLGTAPVPLAAEIHMHADLEVREERTPEGAWKPLSYRVVKVHSIARSGGQRRLPFASEQ